MKMFLWLSAFQIHILRVIDKEQSFLALENA